MLSVTWDQYKKYLYTKLQLDHASYYKTCYNAAYTFFTDKIFTEYTCQEFLGYIESKHLSRSAYNNYLKALKKLSHLMGHSFLDTYKLKKLERPYIPTIEEDEVIRLLRVAYEVDYRRAVALELILSTGLRRGEVIHLRWENVIDTTLFIDDTKSDRSREVEVLPYLKDRIDKLRGNHPIYVFAQGTRGIIEPNYFNKFLRNCANAAGITKYLTIHKLRHIYASLADEKGISLNLLKDILGHTDIRTTSTYIHTTRKRRVEAAKRVSYGQYQMTTAEITQEVSQFILKLNQSGCQAFQVPQTSNIVVTIPLAMSKK